MLSPSNFIHSQFSISQRSAVAVVSVVAIAVAIVVAIVAESVIC